MDMLETPYGVRKRLLFCAEEIEEGRPRNVLDFGCGTGAHLTAPLAEMYPGVQFTGADSDLKSIEHARQTVKASNLRFCLLSEIQRSRHYDVIILSEVLEHVEQPGALLVELATLLNPAGRLIVTIPNGYGPREMLSFFESLLRVTRLFPLIRYVVRMGRIGGGRTALPNTEADTLAVSPHINFFSYREAARLFTTAGFSLVKYRPRTFLCGFVVDQILRQMSLSEWNSAVSERLPRAVNSGWMFTLRSAVDLEHGPHGSRYQRNTYGRIRRYFNEKRWGLR